MDVQQFSALCPAAHDHAEWAAALTLAAAEFEIAGKGIHHWLAQCCHECMGFIVFEENLNYSAQALARVWPSRYGIRDASGNPDPNRPNELAHRLHRKPDAIANDCYANRMGNGDPASGDGWRYRGRGPIQITGRDMYARSGDTLGLDLVSDPELVLNPIVGARVAGWVFAVEKSCLPLAAADNIEAITRRINGGLNGLDDRVAWLRKARLILGE